MEQMCFITEKAKARGFCDVGVCSAEPFYFLRPKLEQTLDLLSGFVEKDVEKRIAPALTMPGVKSIIVLAKSYKKQVELKCETGNSCLEEAYIDSKGLNDVRVNVGIKEVCTNCESGMSSALRGYISLGAVGEDYHTFMKHELSALAAEIKAVYGGEYQCFSDTGPLIDRELALRSGMGFLGANGSVIMKNGGSMVFIGYILTDLSLPAGQVLDIKCSDRCGRCMSACPAGALSAEGFRIERCISYLTQLKRNLTLEETRLLGNSLYGCDKCLLACPRNSGADSEEAGRHEGAGDAIEDKQTPSHKADKRAAYGGTEKITDIDEIMPKLSDILALSNKGFQRKYGHTAMGWRGGNVIKRNALGALGNSQNPEVLGLLKQFADSENSFLRYGAVCGIINLGFEEGILFLKEQYIKETDKQIREVIDHGLLEFKRTEGKRSGRPD